MFLIGVVVGFILEVELVLLLSEGLFVEDDFDAEEDDGED